MKSVTVSPREKVRLSVDVYGLQDILDNGLATDVTFEWSVKPRGGSFAEVDPSVDADTNANEREVIFTAPSSSGRYSVAAALGPSECDDGDGLYDGCVAEIELTVLRPSQPVEPAPTPANPSGAIPSILTDGEGNQYEVFTPEEGGTFDGGRFSITAPSSAVANREYIGLRMYEAGTASNSGKRHQRYTLGGNLYNVAVVDADGNPVTSYVLNTPAKVCLPLPAELSSNISDIVIVATNSDNSLTVLASAVRLTTSGAGICGNISRLSATLSAGRQGAPAAILAPTPEATPLSPDTGGASPSAVADPMVDLADRRCDNCHRSRADRAKRLELRGIPAVVQRGGARGPSLVDTRLRGNDGSTSVTVEHVLFLLRGQLDAVLAEVRSEPLHCPALALLQASLQASLHASLHASFLGFGNGLFSCHPSDFASSSRTSF